MEQIGTRWQILLLVLVIAIFVILGIFLLVGSPACACDGLEFETINSGLAP